MNFWIIIRYFALGLAICLHANIASAEDYRDMVLVDGGSYKPLFIGSEDPLERTVHSFLMDKFLVSNEQYNLFTKSHPMWMKSRVKSIFADENYLKNLPSTDESKSVSKRNSLKSTPVTNISWHSARAYCKSLGKRLPTLDEWEYTARASASKRDGTSDPVYRARILEWYGKPAGAALPDVNATAANYWGVHGMHGVVWELVNDFNSALVTGESRADSKLEQSLFCGAGAASSSSPDDYAAFMRYALRSSYEANYALDALGFRCARDSESSQQLEHF